MVVDFAADAFGVAGGVRKGCAIAGGGAAALVLAGPRHLASISHPGFARAGWAACVVSARSGTLLVGGDVLVAGRSRFRGWSDAGRRPGTTAASRLNGLRLADRLSGRADPEPRATERGEPEVAGIALGRIACVEIQRVAGVRHLMAGVTDVDRSEERSLHP